VKQVVNARGEVMRDLNGQALKRDEVRPSAGKNLVLSIDARLQAEAEAVFPGVAGAVVVMETKTGFIRAMVSRPAFDPNEMTGRVSTQRLAALSKDPLQPMLFRAGAEHYHPGSTFKVVSLLTALRSSSFTPQTSVFCGGGYQLGSRRWRCDKESGHGPMQAHGALTYSCDVYFYRVADVLGIDPLAKTARDLGFGAVTNFSVAAEVPGVIPDVAYHDRYTPGGYTKGMALNAAIGQGDVNVTPLQLAAAYSAIANGGDVMQPQVIARIETPEGEVVEAFTPKVNRHVEISAEQRQVLLDGLKAVVTSGTGFRARLPDVVVAGKTGTAQVVRLGAVRLKAAQLDYWERDHAWFAAFAPADDPEITVVVLNEHAGFGGSTSAPTTAAILRKYFDLKKADGLAFGPGTSGAPTPALAMLPPRAQPDAPAALAIDAGQAPLTELGQPSTQPEAH
jgi:penicillin-binding protein 2